MKRNPKRKELIKLQNRNGKKLGRALHAQAQSKAVPVKGMLVRFKDDDEHGTDEAHNNELNRLLLESFERNK